MVALLWKLASPYDAYVSHVARLNDAIERIRVLNRMTEGYEAGLQGSGRVSTGAAGDAARAARVARFREQLGSAAARMSDVEFEDFISHLGGGAVADPEDDRARTSTRIVFMQRGLEEYFSIAGRELTLLEKRGYDPSRGDVARQLRENKLPLTSVEEFRALLHELGGKVGVRA